MLRGSVHLSLNSSIVNSSLLKRVFSVESNLLTECQSLSHFPFLFVLS